MQPPIKKTVSTLKKQQHNNNTLSREIRSAIFSTTRKTKQFPINIKIFFGQLNTAAKTIEMTEDELYSRLAELITNNAIERIRHQMNKAQGARSQTSLLKIYNAILSYEKKHPQTSKQLALFIERSKIIDIPATPTVKIHNFFSHSPPPHPVIDTRARRNLVTLVSKTHLNSGCRQNDAPLVTLFNQLSAEKEQIKATLAKQIKQSPTGLDDADAAIQNLKAHVILQYVGNNGDIRTFINLITQAYYKDAKNVLESTLENVMQRPCTHTTAAHPPHC
jgi:hypothetical protein